MKKVVGNFIYAILAGMSIALGGTLFLYNSALGGSKLVGSILFAAGLFAVCTLGYNLFTGKVGYLFDNEPKTYVPFLIYVWIGNYIGSIIFGLIIRYVLAGTKDFLATAEKVATTKVNLVNQPFKLFLLGVLCNFLVVLAVEEFRFNQHELGKYLGILVGVTAFVFLGFEHSIANMFYMTVGNKIVEGVPNILIVTLGNIVGGIIVPGCRKLKQDLDK